MTEIGRAQQVTSLWTAEETRLWSAAERIARAMRASEITPYNLLLAVMADVGSPWAELINDSGGTAYSRAADEIEDLFVLVRLPSAKDLYGRSDVNAHRGRPLGRRIVHWIWLIGQQLKVLMKRATGGGEVDLKPSRHAEAVTMQAEKLAQNRSPGQRPTVGHYLVVLASVPGPHQHFLNDKEMLIAARARSALRIERFGDLFTEAFDLPSSLVRLIDRQLFLSSKSRPYGISAFVANSCWWLIKKAATLLQILVIRILFTVLQLLLMPSIVVLTSVRYSTGLVAGVSCHSRGYRTVLGGEGAITEMSYDSSFAPVVTLLLPRLIIYGLGIILLVFFYLRVAYGGETWLSAIIVRPNLLDGILAPVYVTIDAVLTYGWLGALALYTAVGALALGLPTHREMEQSRLILAPATGIGLMVRGWLAPWAFLIHAAESIDEVFGWTAGPFYATLRAIPVIAGALVSVATGHVVGQMIY